MKPLHNFILEAIADKEDVITKVKNLVITYISNKTTVVETPTSYSESDMQIYIDDKLLDALPGSSDNSKELLGDNIKEISDAYFMYSSFTASDDKPTKIDIEFDKKYDSTASNDMVYYSLKDLKYIIEFSEFNLKNIDINNIKQEIENIFSSLESNSENKYPIELKLESVKFER